MALTVGVNTYVTEAEADAYFASRYGYDAWASETNKEGALISAAAALDVMCIWEGEKTDPDQDMAFPRNGDTEIPQGVKDAQCEIAYSMVAAGSTVVAPDDVLTELTAGDVTLKFKGDVNPTGGIITDYGKRLLSQYGSCSFGSGTTIIPIGRS